jgi:hypothetical protein
MPANRDPRKKSRTARNRRTSSSNRSVRSRASAKDTPKPTSSSTRSSTKGTSKKVTYGKGEIKSKRLRQALDGPKKTTKKTPAKTPPKTTQVKTKPASKTPRGAQGPRTAPQQGPSQRVNTRGLIGSKPTKPKTTVKPPPTQKYRPRVDNISDQIRQAKNIKNKNAARKLLRAGGTAAQIRRVLMASNPYTLAATIIGSDIMNRGVADGTLKGKPVAAKPGRNAGNYNTRDADGTIRSRKRVGPKKVGTAEQAFDKAYAAAKKAGKTTFTFDGKSYSTK